MKRLCCYERTQLVKRATAAAAAAVSPSWGDLSALPATPRRLPSRRTLRL